MFLLRNLDFQNLMKPAVKTKFIGGNAALRKRIARD